MSPNLPHSQQADRNHSWCTEEHCLQMGRHSHCSKPAGSHCTGGNAHSCGHQQRTCTDRKLPKSQHNQQAARIGPLCTAQTCWHMGKHIRCEQTQQRSCTTCTSCSCGPPCHAHKSCKSPKRQHNQQAVCNHSLCTGHSCQHMGKCTRCGKRPSPQHKCGTSCSCASCHHTCMIHKHQKLPSNPQAGHSPQWCTACRRWHMGIQNRCEQRWC